MTGPSPPGDARAWFDAPLHIATTMVEIGACALHANLAWQRALWQPALEWQLQCAQQWQERVADWAYAPVVFRGAEQLA